MQNINCINQQANSSEMSQVAVKIHNKLLKQRVPRNLVNQRPCVVAN